MVSVGLLKLDDRIGRAFGESSQNARRAVLVLSGVWDLAGLFLRGLGGATCGDAADGRSYEEQLGNVDHTGRWKGRRGRERESGVERERECKSDEAKENLLPTKCLAFYNDGFDMPSISNPKKTPSEFFAQ